MKCTLRVYLCRRLAMRLQCNPYSALSTRGRCAGGSCTGAEQLEKEKVSGPTGIWADTEDDGNGAGAHGDRDDDDGDDDDDEVRPFLNLTMRLFGAAVPALRTHAVQCSR
eukprot:6211155-Pleurochrysis_carterae.AAC.1